MSAVAAAPVTFPVPAGEALDAVAVPDAALAGELLELLDDEPHAAAAAASAAARMTVGAVFLHLPAVNRADTMRPLAYLNTRCQLIYTVSNNRADCVAGPRHPAGDGLRMRAGG
jgi:hypothetical protein